MPDAQNESDIPDKYYTAIGRIAAAWASLDFEINRTIWDIAGIEQMPGACITAQIVSTRARLSALCSLVELHGGQKNLIGAVEKFIRKSQGLVEERNRQVHDAWMLRMRDKVALRLHITAKDTLEFGFRHIPLEELDDTYIKIRNHVRVFSALRDRLIAELASSRDTARKQFRRIDQISLPQARSNDR